MGLTDAQRRERRGYLGASDAAAVVGLDPYRGPLDVYLEKTGQLIEEDLSSSNHAVELGMYIEPALLAWCSAQLGGVPIRLEESLVHPNGWQLANLDGLSLHSDPPCIVEAKTAGLLGTGASADEWGEAGTDAIPARYLLQIHHQFAVVNGTGGGDDFPRIEWAVVPALLARRGFVLFRVMRDPDLEAVLCEAEARFWQDHVLTRTAPEDGPPPSLETLKRRLRVPEKAVPIDPALVTAYLTARDARLAADAAEETEKAHLLCALEDAEAGDAGTHRVTYLEQTRKSYVVAASTSRVLRVKDLTPKPKKENAR
jgi:putative phage-type endonuclease